MKYLILSLLLWSFNINAQEFNSSVIPYDSVKNEVIYTKIFNCDTFSKKQIFEAALLSVTQIFKSANEVVQLKDESTGKIIVKARFDVYYRILGENRTGGYMTYTFSISIKDKKAKLDINMLTHYGANSQNNIVSDGGSFETFYNTTKYRPWGQFVEQTHNYCINILDSFEKSILTNLASTSNDW